MREILFRGKRTDNCEWAYGAPTKDNHGEMVMVKSTFECEEYNCRGANCLYVDENTVGQYTGLTDKNGKRIFEGDILRLAYHPEEDVIIEWHDGRFNFRKRNHPKDYGYERLCCVQIAVSHLRVIGNIYDNPELLEG